MKLVLFVEGYTERKGLPAFLKRWLDESLAAEGLPPVGFQAIRFEGWADYVRDIAKKVALNLGKTDVIGGIGLLDLYGPTFYPPDKSSASDRYRWAKSLLEDKVSHEAFRQHFAVYETEAWLLSDPSVLPRAVADALPKRASRPESVNFNEPPARLLDRLYTRHVRKPYRKAVDGPNLFRRLDPTVAVAKCPHLKLLLDDALALARMALAPGGGAG